MNKVAFIVSRLVREGPVSHLTTLLSDLPCDMSIRLITADPSCDPLLEEHVGSLGVGVLKLGGNASTWQKAIALRRLVIRESLSTLVSSGFRCDLLNLLSGPRGGRLAIKHEPAWTPWGLGRASTLIMRSAHLAVLSGLDEVICVSEHVRQTMPPWLRSSSSSIRNGIDLTRFRPPSATEREHARDQFGIRDDEKVIVFVGSLDQRKRPNLLVEPAVQLRAQGMDVVLLIAGTGQLETMLMEEARSKPIVLTGFLEDIRSALWAGDVLALPSTHEGMPMAAVEALACNLPVLLSDIAPHRELLGGARTRGVGTLCDPTDTAAMTERLKCLLRNDMGQSPRQWAKAHFDSKIMAGKYALHLRNGNSAPDISELGID